MAVKLIDLQLIYGVAGAREKFEELAAQLVSSEQPDADKVRIMQGDGGIDVYVGDLSDVDGIEVFQCKFFPQGLEDAQKEQIRKSYRTCRDTTKFKTKRWTLCLPVDMSIDEKRWFEDWKSKQTGSGIVVEDHWGAMKLEALLYLEKNKGLKEAFFKEEHLAQIRTMHSMLTILVKDITERLAGNDDTTASQLRLRRDQQLDEFVRTARDHYVSQVQKQVPGKKRPDHWEVNVRPAERPEQEIDALRKCWELVDHSRVRSAGWEYPFLTSNRETGSDWVGATHVPNNLDLEVWRLGQQGDFVHFFPIFDDVQNQTSSPMSPRASSDGFIPKLFIEVSVAVRMITHIFRFAAKLANQTDYPAKDSVGVTITITGTNDRVLASTQPGLLRERCRARVPQLSKTWTVHKTQLQTSADELAVKSAMWFFERFDWLDASEDLIKMIQVNMFGRSPP